MCLDRRGKGGICAHLGLTHLDGPDSYLAVDDTEIGSGRESRFGCSAFSIDIVFDLNLRESRLCSVL